MGCFGSASSKADQEENKRRKEANKKINQQIQKDKQVYRATHRLLLLGKNQKCPSVLSLPSLSVSFAKSSPRSRPEPRLLIYRFILICRLPLKVPVNLGRAQ